MAGHRGQKALTRFRSRTSHQAICGHPLVRLRPGHGYGCRLAHGTRAGSWCGRRATLMAFAAGRQPVALGAGRGRVTNPDLRPLHDIAGTHAATACSSLAQR